MAFKYKLVKETEVGNSKDVRYFTFNPEKINRMGGLVDFKARKEFVNTPANTPRSEELENIIKYSLEEEGFDLDDIENYMEFLYIERNQNLGGKWGDTPLNEKEGKEDPIQTFLDKKLAQWNAENPDYNPDAKNTFKDKLKDKLKEAITKRIKKERGTSRS